MAGITPVRQGQTYPSAQWSFIDDDGNAVPLPTGTTFLFWIYNTKTNTAMQGQGTWTPTNLNGGIATYAYSPLDTAIPGNYVVYAQFTTPSGQVGFTDEEQWTVKPLYGQQ